MDQIDFVQRWEQEAKKEYDSYICRPTSELENEFRANRYGDYFTLWRALGAKSTLKEIGWDLFDFIQSEYDWTTRTNAAKTLISLAGAASHGIDDAVYLTGRNKYDIDRYLQIMKTLLDQKLGKRPNS